uniref:Uncharacterized protein n=1 Tax=Arundo donax TaxID=35708 RepID=A0A0A9ADG5_ARUDO
MRSCALRFSVQSSDWRAHIDCWPCSPCFTRSHRLPTAKR